MRRLVGAILLKQNEQRAVPCARYITLEGVGSVSGKPIVSIAHVEG